MSSNVRAEAARRRWASTPPEVRQEQGRALRRGLANRAIRERIAETRRAQNLPLTVTDDQILMDLAKEVLRGGRDG
jgi:hypothetical protein